jgi:cytochrome c oxidase cbb3-type subunit III
MRNTFKYIAPFLLFALITITASAQDTTAKAATGSSDSWLYWTTAGVLLAIFFFLAVVLYSANSVMKKEGKPFTFQGWWATMNRQFFTKAVPVEREADVLLDHDYDGVKELDNALPPWWKYGFYFTIVVAVLYILRYHVWKTGPDPLQEYNQEMKVAAAQIEEYRLKTGDVIDEKTVTMADATGIAEGDKIFHSNCFACHGAKGEGLVGPNLTDNYWIHGGTINDIFKTIKYGWPEKGMQSWQKMYSPSQIKNLASYIKTLAGTNPPNPKAPQGDLFVESKTDSSSVKTDSAIVKKDSAVATKK